MVGQGGNRRGAPRVHHDHGAVTKGVALTLEAILAGALDEENPNRKQDIRALIASTEEGVDERLLALLADDDASRAGTLRTVVCHVLAERDPDRDPSFALRYFQRDKPNGWRWVDRLVWWQAHHSLMSGVYAIPRLRRANPVEHHARGSRSRFRLVRVQVTTLLGQTADPAALPHVVRLLGDRRWEVRAEAATAVRRLAADGALTAEWLDPVGRALVACLPHRRAQLVERVVAALALPALRKRLVVLRETSALPPATSAVVDAALAGEVLPLAPLWPGDVRGDALR